MVRLSALLLLPAVASALNLRGSRRLQELEERAATIEVNCDEGPPIPAILTEPHCLPSLLDMPLLQTTGDSQKDMEAYMDLICVPGCAEAWDEYIASTLAYTNKCQTTMMYAQQLGQDADLIFVDDPSVAVIQYEDEEQAEEQAAAVLAFEDEEEAAAHGEHSDSELSDSEHSDSEHSDDEAEVMVAHEDEEDEKKEEEEATSMLSDSEDEEESHSDNEEEEHEEEKHTVDAQSDDESDVEEEAHSDDESSDKAQVESDDEASDNEEEEQDSQLTEDEALEMEVNKALENSFAPMSLSFRHKYFRALHTMRSTLQDFLESEGIDYDVSLIHRQDERANSFMFLGFMLGCQRDPVDNQYCATKPFSFEPRRCDIFDSCCWGEMVNKVDHDMHEDYSPFEDVCPGLVIDNAAKRC